MPDNSKFSNFANGGELDSSDIVVGLRSGVNTKFTYNGGLSPSVVVPIDQGGTGATNATEARTNLGLAIGSDVQAWNANLDGLSALASTGFVAQTAANTFTERTVTGTANEVDVADGNGVSGNPTLSLSATLDAPGTFTIQGTVALDAVIDDDTMATATDSNIATAESIKAYVDSVSGGLVDSVTGTANEVDVNNTDPANPVLSLSSTIDAPGTLTIQGTVAVDSIIDDDSMATATDTNLATAESIKAYVDNVAGSGFTVVLTCLLGTTANLSGTYNNGTAGVGATLTNNTTQAALQIDGVTVQVADRILVKDQTSTEENGVYVVTTVGTGATDWVLTRATDYDTAAEIVPGTLVPISAGDTNGGSIWLESATVTTVGTDPIVFNIFAQPAGTFVTLATTQTVSGAKTFSSNVVLSGGSTLDLNGSTAIDGFIDDDTFATASATTGATSESIKAYVDAQTALTWSTDATGTITASINNGYICGAAGATTATLPATAAIGSLVALEGLGAGGWVLTANTGQTIQIGSDETSSAGTLTSAAATDNVYVTCIVANTTWRVRSTNSAGLTIA